MPASSWINHVKAYAKQHNISYGEAMKKAKTTYKKGGAIKGGRVKKKKGKKK